MANNYTYYGTAGTSASGNTTVFTFRCSYILVQNLSANTLYFTTDAKTAPVTTGGDGIFAVPPNTQFNSYVMIPNQQPLWYQSMSVIAKGSLLGNGPFTGTPYEIGSPYGSSLAGGQADPGTILNFIASAVSSNFVATAAG